MPRSFLLAVSIALLILSFGIPARAQDGAGGVDIPIEWNRFRDLETLVARVESEGSYRDKDRFEPVTRHSWGTLLHVLPGPELFYPIETPTREAELDFFSAYLKQYSGALESAQGRSMEIAAEHALVKDVGDSFPAFAQRFLGRYKLDGLARSARDPESVDLKKRAAAEIVRFMQRIPGWEKEFHPLRQADAAGLTAEWERRAAEARKVIKRFDLGKDVGTGELSGTSVFDVKLGATGLEFAKNAVGGLRTFPVVGTDGKPWKVNGEPLLVCSEKSLPDVNSYVKDVRQEYVVFRYRQLGFGDTKTKDVIRLVCARLYLGPRYFLFYRDRVIVFLKDRPGK